MEFEMLVLQKLEWDMSAITAHDYLEQILCRFPCYRPSVIAGSCISAAASGLLGSKIMNDLQLVYRIQLTIKANTAHLQSCQQQIEQKLSENLLRQTKKSPT